MSPETSSFLAVVATYIGLIPSILAIIKWKSFSPDRRLLAILVWGGTSIGILARFISFTLRISSNLFLLHFYTIFDFILLTLIFKPVLPRGIFRLLIIAFPLFAGINSIFFEKLITVNVLNRSISTFTLMFYALSFFATTLREMKIQRLDRYPLFWISIGVLFYNAASFFIFIFSKDITPTEPGSPAYVLFFTYFGLHAIFTIILYSFYTTALWVRPNLKS